MRNGVICVHSLSKDSLSGRRNSTIFAAVVNFHTNYVRLKRRHSEASARGFF